MTTSEEQLQEWEALVPRLNDDADDHMDVAHSADMRPEHTANYRHAKNAHEAAYAIHSLIADLREAREQLASPYMDGYEAAKEEYRPQVIALEAKLGEIGLGIPTITRPGDRLKVDRDGRYVIIPGGADVGV